MLTITDFSHRLADYMSTERINLVRRAYYFAEQAHDGQMRRSGEPYITHPLAVAAILADFRMDHACLMAAMLHDVIEDTGIDKKAIALQFGDIVSEIVDGVSKLSHIHFENKALAQAENFRKMALAMAHDIRVILVKLADRLHNMRTLGVLKQEKRMRIAKETLEIYVPIAKRLGMHQMSLELEDLGFAAMYPLRSRLIKQAVEKIKGNRRYLVDEIRNKVIDCLKTKRIKAIVMGREKNLYSIYQKMQSKHKSFSEIMDVFAFRIIVSSIDSSYRALGASHGLYKPIPGRFKDYIAIPKANGYQSLHTTLFGVSGVPIEIQIRTQEMEDMANNGIAAHWLYKSGEEALSGSKEKTSQWLDNLLDLQHKTDNPLDFIENVKIDLFPDEVYVFTPKGLILELPSGATPVDFAYAVHTDVGNSCVACRVDKKLFSLSQPLQSGQTVEIVTAKNTRPNIMWLNFVVTGKARSNIRHLLKNRKKSESIVLGKDLLCHALEAFGHSWKQISIQAVNAQLKQMKLESVENLFEKMGLGDQVAYSIARKLIARTKDSEDQKNTIDVDVVAKKKNKENKPLAIKGAEGMMIYFAECCCPIPGDAIIGFVALGKGLVIHADSCHTITGQHNDSKRRVDVIWDKQVQGEFAVGLQVNIETRKGMIAAAAMAVTSSEASIETISIEGKSLGYFYINLLIKVCDRQHLAEIMKRIRRIKGVSSINRSKQYSI